MNKKIMIGISVILLVVLASIEVSYAINNIKENPFFTVNKKEISPEETLEMTIDISKIKYDKFNILLDSNVDSEGIYTDDKTNIKLEDDENAISISVDKQKMNLDKITLYYPIKKNTKIGTKIQFTAKILIKENNTMNNTVENNIINEIDNNILNNASTEVELEDVIVDEQTIEIVVIEKVEKDDNNNKEEKNNEQKEEKDKQEDNSKLPEESKQNISEETKMNKNEKESTNMQAPNNNMNNSNSNTQKTFMTGSGNSNFGSTLNQSEGKASNEKQETYNGSNDNYLSKLQLKGIELNTEFNKENTNYFVSVKNTNNITVVATPEDETAKVNITGNKSITNGKNKILISVTAENGDVRYYRIWVNCEEETNET